MACSTARETRTRPMPPTYFLAALVVVIASRFALPMWAYAAPLTLAAGAVLVVAGTALDLLSDSAFKKLGTTVRPDATPTTLVVSGVFRITRNPMYLGMALILAGAALLVGAPAGVVVAPVFVALMDRLFVPGEETKLEAVFGGAYADYRASVRRWV